MENVCGGAKPYMNTETIESEHRRVRDKAIFAFNAKKKMGGEEFSQTYREQLEKVNIFIFHIYMVSMLFVVTFFSIIFISSGYRRNI